MAAEIELSGTPITKSASTGASSNKVLPQVLRAV